MTRVRLLDLQVTPKTSKELVGLLKHAAQEVELVLNHNLHSAYFYHRETWFRAFYDRARVIAIDGWPILRLTAGGLSSAYRVGSTDWIAELWRVARSEGVPPGAQRVFLIGGTKQTNAAACARFESEAAAIATAGRDGYFDVAIDADDVVRELTAFRPTLVLVGLGMPLQEQFLSSVLSQLPPARYATVGGAIDYIAGDVALAPRILGRLGLEWMWRFLHDPKRLFWRYFVEPSLLFALIVRGSLRRRRAST